MISLSLSVLDAFHPLPAQPVDGAVRGGGADGAILEAQARRPAAPHGNGAGKQEREDAGSSAGKGERVKLLQRTSL